MNEFKFTSLSELVDLVRKWSRDVLRMHKINSWKQKLMGLNADLKALDKQIPAAEKEVARAKYAVEKLDPEDPDYEDNLKSANEYLDETVKNLDEVRKDVKEVQDEINKRIEDANTAIEEWESGKRKVDKDTLERVTNEKLHEVYPFPPQIDTPEVNDEEDNG